MTATLSPSRSCCSLDGPGHPIRHMNVGAPGPSRSCCSLDGPGHPIRHMNVVEMPVEMLVGVLVEMLVGVLVEGGR